MALGVYIIGGRGNVALTSFLGACGIRRGKVPSTGLVSELPDFAALGLCSLDQLIFGGCDLVKEDLYKKAVRLSQKEGFLPLSLVEELQEELKGFDTELDQGLAFNSEGMPDGGYVQAIKDFSELLQNFKTKHKLRRVIVVNLASTEASVTLSEDHVSPDAFRQALNQNKPGLASQAMLYAWAALELGMPFINFTPSQACEVPALEQLAYDRGVAVAGKDGKTGETLLKSVLAPFFVQRALKVQSWLATNYLGNNDGRILADPLCRSTKLGSKDQALRAILGDEPHLSTDIGYAPSLGDWKTAWDLIHFEGFLGTKMTLQFTWQGCDSVLAAPLALDLVRFVDYAAEQGEAGPLPWLASFFKSPQNCEQHAFQEQFQALVKRFQ